MTNEADLKNRTKSFSLRAIDLAIALPEKSLGQVVRKQLLRACTSVAANYRAACRSKSKSDFVYKLSLVDEELDECMYWMEIIMEKKLQPEPLVRPLYEEADELLSIIVASIKTARTRSSSYQNPKSKI